MGKNSDKKPRKVLKNIEIVSMIASGIETFKSGAKKGERIRITPFSESIIMSNDSHPHVETVKGKLMEALLWQNVLKGIKLIRDPKKDEIKAIEFVGDEISQDSVNKKLDKILNLIDKKRKK